MNPRDQIPVWAVFPMAFGVVLLMLLAIILFFFSGPLAFDILGPDAPMWQMVLFFIGSMAASFGCGTGAALIMREMFR